MKMFDRLLFGLWCLLLVGQIMARPSFMGEEGNFGGGPERPGFHHPRAPGSRKDRPLHPRFTPIAGDLPVLLSPSPIAGTGGGSLPPPAGFPGSFGQTSAAFAPPPPVSLGVGPPPVGVIPPVPLGQGPSAFAPSAPQLSIVPIAGAPVAAGAGGIPLFIPFALGPTALLNQFLQPPLLPFGQVGLQPVPYLPGFFSGNVNPFNRTCNYYFFAGCGASGGEVTNFNFSSR